ncbi:MAG: segregation and condensation protein B [Gracilibacter sp. BRH_c7a]|nr:MAG: segregation and condensation protein B [Gracilibacter sp. BRH_c7a]
MLFREAEVAALEALLFVAKDPLSAVKIAEIMEISEENVQELVDTLQERYEDPLSGLILIELDNGYKIGTKPSLARYIEILYKQPTQTLSNAALEVLSIVAYKQPLTRGEIDFIRGVHSDTALATLVEKGLVKEVGRKDSPGRPILYGTTDVFLLHFGLKSLNELPELEINEDEES